MNINSIQLIVLFDDPFWIGFFETINRGEYSVAKKIFGAEPTNLNYINFYSTSMRRYDLAYPPLKMYSSNKGAKK